MIRSWITWISVVFLTAFLPAFFLCRFFDGLKQERIFENRRKAWDDMEEVLARTRRNGRPDLYCKTLIDQAAISIGRGISPQEALNRVKEKIPEKLDFFLFAPDCQPQPIGNTKPTKVLAWRQFMQSVDGFRRSAGQFSMKEQKFSSQLTGDLAGISVIARSQGHFRRLGTQTIYTHGGWWKIGDPKLRFHLLVFIKSKAFEGISLLKISTSRSAAKCKGIFSISLVGQPHQKSFLKLPREIRHSFSSLPGNVGRFHSAHYMGVSLSCDKGFYLIASKKPENRPVTSLRGASPGGWIPEDFAKTLVSSLAILFSTFLFPQFIFNRIRKISLRLIIPVLLMVSTIPILFFLVITMRDQRQKILEKEIYETHRRIEGAIFQVDSGFTNFQEEAAVRYRNFLDAYHAAPDNSELGRFSRSLSTQSVSSAYLFGKGGGIVQILKSAIVAPAEDKKLAEGIAEKLVKVIFGLMSTSSLEDPFFSFILRDLGHLHSMNVFDKIQLRFLDFRSFSGKQDDLLGLIVNVDSGKMQKEYLRGVLRNRSLQNEMDIAVVSGEGETLLKSAPPGFLQWAEAARAGEKALEGGRTIDAIFSDPKKGKLLCTMVPCRNLNGFLLLGAVPLETVFAKGNLIATWTWAVSGIGVTLAFFSAVLLVRWIVTGFNSLRTGIEKIASNHYEFKLPLKSADEFGKLAEGLEKAAVTLEEIYFSLPVRGTLITSDPIQHPRFSAISCFDPGTVPAGDYLDGFHLGEKKYAVAIGSTLTEGWQTTLVVAEIRIAVRLLLGRSGNPLQNVMEELDRHLKSMLRNGGMNLFIGILDFAENTLEYAGAGNLTPLLIGKTSSNSDDEKKPAKASPSGRFAGTPPAMDGSRSMQRGIIRMLESDLTPMGTGFSREFSPGSVSLETGDTLLFYTDGWENTLNTLLQPLGKECFVEIVQSITTNDSALFLDELKRRIRESGFTNHAGDDRSLVVLTRLPEKSI